MCKRVVSIVLVTCACVALCQDVSTIYSQCVKDGIYQGYSKWICDPDSLLNSDSTTQLNRQLLEFQSALDCPCVNSSHCYRDALTIQSSYVASVLVLDREYTDIDQIGQQMVEDTGNDVNCSNSIVLVAWPGQTRVYVGDNVQLDNTSIAGLVSAVDNNTDVAAALQSTLDGVFATLDGTPTTLQTVLMWMGVGVLIIACLIVLLCFMRLCCVCCDNRKDQLDDKKQLRSPQSSKADPIYSTARSTGYANSTFGSRPSSYQEYLDPQRKLEVQSKQIILEDE